MLGFKRRCQDVRLVCSRLPDHTHTKTSLKTAMKGLLKRKTHLILSPTHIPTTYSRLQEAQNKRKCPAFLTILKQFSCYCDLPTGHRGPHKAWDTELVEKARIGYVVSWPVRSGRGSGGFKTVIDAKDRDLTQGSLKGRCSDGRKGN